MFDEPGLRYSHQAMRTTFTFFFPTPDPNNYLGIAEDCITELVDIELSISPYQEGSDIHRLNAAAGTGEWIRVGWPTYRLLHLCMALMDQSHGAFNPFDGHRTMRVSGKVLDEQTTRMLEEQTREAIGTSVPLELDETHPQCQLSAGYLIDLGAIGKGWALDKCAAIAKDAGVERAFFNAGGSSMIAIGTEWPINIAGIDESITISNQALSVSKLINADAGGVHIVGREFPNKETDIVSRVVGESCAVTDALSTAAIAYHTDLEVHLYDYEVVTKVIRSTNKFHSEDNT
jgi:thiamine biosynthesis lipoprotein